MNDTFPGFSHAVMFSKQLHGAYFVVDAAYGCHRFFKEP